MHPKIASLFDEAETHYLNSDELGLLSQYVDSLPTRLNLYRTLRDRELEIMQSVADQLQAQFPQESQENLERAIRNGLLSMRYCAMAMLLNNETFVQERLKSWMSGTMGLYNSQTIQTINASLYRLLQQQLSSSLSPQDMNLLAPHLANAQSLIAQPAQASAR
jgi:hypothetical protein